MVESFARSRRLTPFMVIAAAYQALLHRCTGQDDFCVGVPTAARTTVDSERTVGYFSSTLVLRADFAGDPSFDAVLRRIRGDWLRALTHGRVPFERLTEELRQDRDTGRTPVFQTLLTVHTQSGGALGEHPFADLVCAEGDGGHTAAKFELSLDVRPDGNDLHAVFGYRTDLLDAAQTALIADRFEVLLRAALEAPDTPVRLLPVLDEHELAVQRGRTRGPLFRHTPRQSSPRSTGRRSSPAQGRSSDPTKASHAVNSPTPPAPWLPGSWPAASAGGTSSRSVCPVVRGRSWRCSPHGASAPDTSRWTRSTPPLGSTSCSGTAGPPSC